MSTDGVAKKSSLEKLQTMATIFSLIAVPLIVAVLGFMIQQSNESAEARTKVLELAIQILKEPVSASTQPGLRQWAIEMLGSSSNIPISQAAKRELAAKPLLPIQPGQINYTSNGFMGIGDKTGSDQGPWVIGSHNLYVRELGKDYALFDDNGRPLKLFMNDAAVLDPGGCVLHLMGFERDITDAEMEAVRKRRAKEEDTNNKLYLNARRSGPLNTAMTAWVCP
jgi:hypothetical protein